MSLSVGIPFRNSERTLAKSIQSVFAQTYTDWELILVDDGSTDRSLEIARAVKDPRVRVYADGKHLKLAARLNQITRLAGRPYLARLDADDMASPDRFEKQIRVLETTPRTIVTSDMAIVSDDGRPTGYRRGDPLTLSLANLLRFGPTFPHAPMMARTGWFRANPYDERHTRTEDIELWLRLHARGRLAQDDILVIKEPLYFCRKSPASPDKLWRSFRERSRLLFRYGPRAIGPVATGTIFVSRLAKLSASLLLHRLGRLERTQTRLWNTAIQDPALAARIEEMIARIDRTDVPGWTHA